MFNNDKPKYRPYSDILGKPFDTVDELEKAEQEFKTAEDEKKKKSELRRQDAQIVSDAILKERETIKLSANKKAEALKKYNDAVKAAREIYRNEVEVIDTEVKQAGKDKKLALDNFLANHPEGYHETLKDSDGVSITYNYGVDTSDYDYMFNKYFGFANLLSEFFR